MIHYTLVLATALHICTQAFLFSERPDQCSKVMDTAAREFHLSGLAKQPITDVTRDKERDLWIMQTAWLINKECGEYRVEAPRQYVVCVNEVKSYMTNLREKMELRAKRLGGIQ